MNTKQLRQKILNLAIRGRLVPQDPNDEPASVLLERVRAEKEQLITEGKIKEIEIKTNTEKSKNTEFEIPNSWEWVSIGSLGKVGSSKRVFTDELVEMGVPFYRGTEIGALAENKSIRNSLYISNEHYQALISDSGYPSIGDLLMPSICPDGRIWMVDTKEPFYFKDGRVLWIHFDSNEFDKKYIHIALKTMLIKTFSDIASGSTFAELKIFILRDIEIPFPPLAEQRRIVTAIESAFAVIDEIERNKTYLQAAVAAAKQKILSLAISGKLVPQDPNDEPAEVLLEHIRLEREQLIKAGKIKRNKKDSTVFEIDEIRYRELPQGWKYARLSDICLLITDGTHQTPTYSEKGYVFLSSKNVTSGKIDWDNVMYIPQELHDVLYNRLAPEVGDILLAKNGTTGYAAVVDRDCVFDIYVSLALIRVFKNEIHPEYLRHIISSELVQAHFKGNLKGIGVPNLHLEHIRSAILPICPLAEQRRIVAAIESAFEQLDRVAAELL